MDLFAGACAGVVQTMFHPLDTMKVLIQNKKPFRGLPVQHLYRGAGPPLAVSIAFNATVFPTYHYMQARHENRWLSGAVAGLVVTPFVFFLENAKIMLQMKQRITVKRLMTTNALAVTASREVGAMAIYFSSYETLRERGAHPMVAGGCSGIANWATTYPLDVVRTRMVAQRISFQAAMGAGHLYRGLGLTLARAAIVNACVFYTFEVVRNFTKNTGY